MLKLFDRSWLAIVMLLTVAALPVRTQAQAPTVVISEIAWAGSSISASDEWIELANIGNEPVDISGWTITGAGSSGADLVLPDGSIAEPQSTYLIANYEHAHANTALAVAPNFAVAALSLPNGGFTLSLLDDAGAVIDVAGGSGAPFAGRSGGTGDSVDGRYASMVRVDGLNDGSLKESWVDATASTGFKEGVGDYGTPGSFNFTISAAESPDTQDDSTTVRINEFVVDPHEGEAEWIELFNERGAAIDLTGWTLEDATGKQTVLEGLLAPGAYLLVTAPLGKLNNDTDMIILKDATGVTFDSVEYGTDELASPKDGAALARGASGSFELTYATTPGEMNAIDPVKPEVEETLLQDDNAVTIRINEFVVDPMGEAVEWIELYNAGGAMTLDGWTIEDASGNITDLSGLMLDADSYLVIESPKGNLNNDGDTITLKDASGTIVESVVYGGDGYPVPKDGDSLARDAETFEITQLTTPGSPNLIFVALEEVVGVEETSVPPDTSDLADISDANAVSEQILEELVILKTLHFVSIYPNTTGSDEEEEYVTLKNTGTEAIDLLGWSIQDGSAKNFVFKDSVSVAAGATIQVGRPQTKLTLNNGGDTLELIAPDGEAVDLVAYGKSAKGATYDLIDGTWTWSPSAIVVESIEVESTTPSHSAVSASTPTASSASTTSTKSVQLVTIAQAKEQADGQKVMVKGMVTSAPGVFGSQIFYLEDGTGGMQVYLYSGDFPELALGDVVQVTGELSTSRGERRIKLTNAAGAVPANGAFTSQPLELGVSEVDESLVGILMTTQGLIQSIDTNKLVIEKEGVTLTIYLKSNPVIDTQQFARGDKIEVTGVLTSYDGELRLRPRSVNDIEVVEQAVVASAITAESSGDSNAGMILLLTTMAALAALALRRYLPRRRISPAAA